MPNDPVEDRPVFVAVHRTLLRAPNSTPQSLANWFPVLHSLVPQGLWWRYLGDRPFDEPIFTQTLDRQPHDQRQRCFTDVAALDDLPPALPLAALIFHVSRCGSTLLAQMLATLEHCVVLSEPPVIDSLLYHYQQGALDRGACLHRLRGLARALGQRRAPVQRHLIVKLDCWHLQHMGLLREAFPDTPALFLYRDPLDVLASHQRQRGPQMLPGMLDADWIQAPPDLQPGDLDRYCLHVLARFMDTALPAVRDGVLMPVDYRQLPSIVNEHLLSRLGVRANAGQQARMHERTQRHAKHDQPFRGDPAPVQTLGAPPGPVLLERVRSQYQALVASTRTDAAEQS